MAGSVCCTHVKAAPASVFAATDDAKKRVALTFDDGPSLSGSTDRILQSLERYGIKATFFVIGSQIDAAPAQLQRTYEAGHLIGNHSFTHPEFSTLSAAQMLAEIDPTSERIEGLGIPTPRYFRPPYGDRDGSTLSDILEERGLQAVLWTIDSRDWEIQDADQVYGNVLRDLRQAWDASQLTNIVLFHDIQPHTPDVVELVIPALIDEGCEFVQVDAIV